MHRSEEVIYQALTDTDGLERIVREGFSPDFVPNEAMRKVFVWSVDYFRDSGFTMAPSRESLLETWGEIIAREGIELPDPDLELDTVEWAMQDLRSKHAVALYQDLAYRAVSEVMNADPTEKVGVIENISNQMFLLVSQLRSHRNEKTAAEGIRNSLANYHIRAARQESIYGMTLGLGEIDEHLLGIRPGEICVFAGAPASGKSLMSIKAALDSWMRGHRVVLFTLENSVEMTHDRMIVSALNTIFRDDLDRPIDLRVWDEGSASETHLRLAKELQKMMEEEDRLHVIMPDREGRTPEAMVNHAMMLNADMIIIDQLTHMRSSKEGSIPSKHERVAHMMHELKTLVSAGNKALPCLLFHQLRRDGADKNEGLTLSDLADSSEVERTADIVMGLTISEAEKIVQRATLSILKHRRGRTKTSQISWRRGEVTGAYLHEVYPDEDE